MLYNYQCQIFSFQYSFHVRMHSCKCSFYIICFLSFVQKLNYTSCCKCCSSHLNLHPQHEFFYSREYCTSCIIYTILVKYAAESVNQKLQLILFLCLMLWRIHNVWIVISKNASRKSMRRRFREKRKFNYACVWIWLLERKSMRWNVGYDCMQVDRIFWEWERKSRPVFFCCKLKGRGRQE